jgi:hypothetical protein
MAIFVRECAGSIATGQWPSLQITLHLQNAKVYEILNTMVAQNGKAMGISMVRPSRLQSSDLWYVPIATAFQIGCFGKTKANGAIGCGPEIITAADNQCSKTSNKNTFASRG